MKIGFSALIVKLDFVTGYESMTRQMVVERANEVEHGILRVMTSHGVLVASHGCKQGPQHLTFALELLTNTKEQIDKAMTMALPIEGAIRDSPVNLRYSRGFVYVQIRALCRCQYMRTGCRARAVPYLSA